MWLPKGVVTSPAILPEKRAVDETLSYIREVLVASREFREAINREVGGEWAETLPRGPLAKAEARMLVCRQIEGDELAVISSWRSWIRCRRRSSLTCS